MDRMGNRKCAIRKGFTPLEIEIPNRVSPVSDRGSYRVSKRFLTGPVRKISSNGAGFTLVELLVVIAIIALLMSILMPSLARVRKQAKAVLCQSNLKQWGLMFSMYTGDNDGYFMEGYRWGTASGLWMNALRKYHDISEGGISCCPAATKPVTEGGRMPFAAWGVFDGSLEGTGGMTECWGKGDYGSYGINLWAYRHRAPGAFGTAGPNYWGTADVKGAANIPVFLDCRWTYAFVQATDSPPPYAGGSHSPGYADICWVCIDRHQGGINGVFMDWSVRKIGLKELWTLKWHRTYDTCGPWTECGGANPSDWPDWMRKFKDY